MNQDKQNIEQPASSIQFEEPQTTVQSQLQATNYSDDDIKTLDWMEHIRRRPGMYIG